MLHVPARRKKTAALFYGAAACHQRRRENLNLPIRCYTDIYGGLIGFSSNQMVAGAGVEPASAGYEPDALPLGVPCNLKRLAAVDSNDVPRTGAAHKMEREPDFNRSSTDISSGPTGCLISRPRTKSAGLSRLSSPPTLQAPCAVRKDSDWKQVPARTRNRTGVFGKTRNSATELCAPIAWLASRLSGRSVNAAGFELARPGFIPPRIKAGIEPAAPRLFLTAIPRRTASTRAPCRNR